MRKQKLCYCMYFQRGWAYVRKAWSAGQRGPRTRFCGSLSYIGYGLMYSRVLRRNPWRVTKMPTNQTISPNHPHRMYSKGAILLYAWVGCALCVLFVNSRRNRGCLLRRSRCINVFRGKNHEGSVRHRSRKTEIKMP